MRIPKFNNIKPIGKCWDSYCGQFKKCLDSNLELLEELITIYDQIDFIKPNEEFIIINRPDYAFAYNGDIKYFQLKEKCKSCGVFMKYGYISKEQ